MNFHQNRKGLQPCHQKLNPPGAADAERGIIKSDLVARQALAKTAAAR
jgi:hypothetical protein